MTPEQYLRALKKLGLSHASEATAEALGITVRTSQRYASGETEIPATIAKLLACMIAAQRVNLVF